VSQERDLVAVFTQLGPFLLDGGKRASIGCVGLYIPAAGLQHPRYAGLSFPQHQRLVTLLGCRDYFAEGGLGLGSLVASRFDARGVKPRVQ